MKRILLILVMFGGVLASVYAQAPSSIAGLTLRFHYQDFEALGADEEASADFFADGTFRESYLRAFPHTPQQSAFYEKAVSGTYSYTLTSTTTAVVNLSVGLLARLDPLKTLTLSFSEANEGQITNTPYGSIFSLTATGGVASERALVNMSALVPARRGSTTALGFVVGGTAPFREIFVRAVGPTLAQFGISNFAANPGYTLYRPSSSGDAKPTTLGLSAPGELSSIMSGEATRVGAFPLSVGSADRADIFLLRPGAYLITVNPTSSDQEGTELIEVYEVE